MLFFTNKQQIKITNAVFLLCKVIRTSHLLINEFFSLPDSSEVSSFCYLITFYSNPSSSFCYLITFHSNPSSSFCYPIIFHSNPSSSFCYPIIFHSNPSSFSFYLSIFTPTRAIPSLSKKKTEDN